ncbi:hypothetical protein PPTG_04081 [Phytophthora nicotianae INRA-310]|uniref:Ubiquitin-like protease family profile domain-containing protein n=1 Tax=Phytophthora nicotianae (strain INRA-310) TaxID=761204 RepID=W2R1A7_PHYN3|nr:hypothetical protein PPTG_04081 [Phytophthora nicotianae INRA-310]ETN18489.1 hypothetical protein PPTG_04081 [Phytophthora nicotianae INRA-310]
MMMLWTSQTASVTLPACALFAQAIEEGDNNSGSAPPKVAQSEQKAWDTNRKFREANQVANSITTTMSSLGMREYREALCALNSVAELFKKKQFSEIHRRLEGYQPHQPQRQVCGLTAATDLSSSESDLPPTGRRSAAAGCSDNTYAPVTNSIVELIDSRSKADSAEAIEHFEIASPVRPRGRPKQQTSAKKAKKNREITHVHHDSNMHHMQIDISVLSTIPREDHTFNSAEKILRKYRLFEIEKKQNKQLIAHRKNKLPPKKVALGEGEISRILSKEVLRKCSKKMTTLQAKHNGLQEIDVVLEVQNIGIFTAETLRTMRNYHRAIDAIVEIDKAIDWVATIDFAIEVDPRFRVEEDETLLDDLKTTRLQSKELEILDIVGRGNFGDAVLWQNYSRTTRELSLYPPKITMDVDAVEATLSTIAGEGVIIPISFNSNHWCAIMIDIAKRIVYIYDSMQSSYLSSVRVVAEKLTPMLASSTGERFRVQRYESDVGAQLDNYSFDLFIMLAFEHFTGALSLGRLDKKLMMYLRYRYLSLCLREI